MASPKRTKPTRALAPLEAWYLDRFRAISADLKRPPSVLEFSSYVDRSTTPVYRMITRLRSLGYLELSDRHPGFVAVRR